MIETLKWIIVYEEVIRKNTSTTGKQTVWGATLKNNKAPAPGIDCPVGAL